MTQDRTRRRRKEKEEEDKIRKEEINSRLPKKKK